MLATKFYCPPLRPDVVTRPRLLQQFQRSLTCPLTLVSAPAGYGKTTAVTSWLHQLAAAATEPARIDWAWLSLDEADNDPVRFWSYVISALHAVCPAVGEKALALLQSAQSLPIPLILTSLINDLATLAQPLFLVLDDYHLIQTRAIHESLTFWLEHWPPHLRLILTSRMDPPLPLARLRVRGQLNEIRMADLRFTTGEAAQFLHKEHGLPLSSGDVALLEARTEGWIAGLQLAALALDASPADHATFVAEFRGTHRHLIDYLTEEVLERQPESVQQFLLHTALLERFCAPLCTAVLPDNIPLVATQGILEQLDRANLFLISLDQERYWYRYHHLFADLLRLKARQQLTPEQISTLHRHAAAWLASHQFPTEAIRLALDAPAPDLAGQLIAEQALPAVLRGETATLVDWLVALPPAFIEQDVRLGLAQAWADLFSGQEVAAAMRLTPILKQLQAGSDPQNPLLGEAWALQATLMMGSAEAEQSISAGQEALRLLPDTAVALRSLIIWHLAFTYRMIGQTSQSIIAYREAITLSRRGVQELINLSARRELAELLWARGDRRTAQTLLGQLLTEMAAPGLVNLYPGYGSHILLAEIAYETNQLDVAFNHLEAVLPLPPPGLALDAYGYALLVQVCWAKGDVPATEEAVRQTKERLAQAIHPNRQALTLARMAHFWLNQGNLTQAALWLADVRDIVPHPGNQVYLQVAIAQARYRFLVEGVEKVRPHLEELLQNAEAGGRVLDQLRLHLYLAHDQMDPTPHLHQALALAEPVGLIRPFTDMGSAVGTWLAQSQGQPGLSASFLNQLLATFTLATTLPANRLLIEPLSDRELEVLRLMAEGYTNREIADKLIFTLATAKKHAEHIYGKLGVNSRTQAIARGRELGLIH